MPGRCAKAPCPICEAMRQGLASYEAQLPCGCCPACCGCRAGLIERLKAEWLVESDRLRRAREAVISDAEQTANRR